MRHVVVLHATDVERHLGSTAAASEEGRLVLKDERWAPVFGGLAGVLGGAFAVPSPFVVMYAAMRRWDTEPLRCKANLVFVLAAMRTLVTVIDAARGEYNVRHDGLNNVWVDASRAGLAVPVTTCSKGRRSDYQKRAAAARAFSDFNDGHIPDWGARGAARNGRHLVGETKCVCPIVPHSTGRGSRGGIACVGATRPFGNTEEELVKENYGLAERGIHYQESIEEI